MSPKMALTVVALLVAVAATQSEAVRYKGTYLCNWLVKLEDFFLCHSDKEYCVPPNRLCDKEPDCEDESDEMFCVKKEVLHTENDFHKDKDRKADAEITDEDNNGVVGLANSGSSGPHSSSSPGSKSSSGSKPFGAVALETVTDLIVVVAIIAVVVFLLVVAVFLKKIRQHHRRKLRAERNASSGFETGSPENEIAGTRSRGGGGGGGGGDGGGWSEGRGPWAVDGGRQSERRGGGGGTRASAMRPGSQFPCEGNSQSPLRPSALPSYSSSSRQHRSHGNGRRSHLHNGGGNAGGFPNFYQPGPRLDFGVDGEGSVASASASASTHSATPTSAAAAAAEDGFKDAPPTYYEAVAAAQELKLPSYDEIFPTDDAELTDEAAAALTAAIAAAAASSSAPLAFSSSRSANASVSPLSTPIQSPTGNVSSSSHPQHSANHQQRRSRRHGNESRERDLANLSAAFQQPGCNPFHRGADPAGGNDSNNQSSGNNSSNSSNNNGNINDETVPLNGARDRSRSSSFRNSNPEGGRRRSGGATSSGGRNHERRSAGNGNDEFENNFADEGPRHVST